MNDKPYIIILYYNMSPRLINLLVVIKLMIYQEC